MTTPWSMPLSVMTSPSGYRCERAVCTTCLVEVLEGKKIFRKRKNGKSRPLPLFERNPSGVWPARFQYIGDVKAGLYPHNGSPPQTEFNPRIG